MTSQKSDWLDAGWDKLLVATPGTLTECVHIVAAAGAEGVIIRQRAAAVRAVAVNRFGLDLRLGGWWLVAHLRGWRLVAHLCGLVRGRREG